MVRRRLNTLVIAFVVALGSGGRLALAQGPPPSTPPVTFPTVSATWTGTGRIAGQVLDRETGRPVQDARVTVSGRAEPVLTDLDGRYRLLALPAGTYAVRVAAIGYQPAESDSVLVQSGQTRTENFALSAVAVQVSGITVTAAATPTPASAAALLAMQQASPIVSDGISAELMSRAPDADAADAVRRVTGVSVVDNRFVVVRGLPERYNNTTLNGAELVSPEPLRRVVPLDIFPASLLEGIVTTKTATPDRPGDFAGGSIEVRTKEFPEQFTANVSLESGFNSQVGLRSLPYVSRSGLDWLAFGSHRRAPPPEPPAQNFQGVDGERFAEAMRDVWTPAPHRALPVMKLQASIGDLLGSGRIPIGYVLSFSWASRTQHTPRRLFSIMQDLDQPPERSLNYEETSTTVDWGGLANFSVRLGNSSKLSWRNLYTRNDEEAVISNSGFDTENSRVVRQYQVRYIAQSLIQTQLAGEHQVGLLGSRLEWRGTLAEAARDEPDNRQAVYILDDVTGTFAQAETQPSFAWVRSLRDRLHTVQLDWSIPFRIRTPADGLLKTGGFYKRRFRDFDAALYRYLIDGTSPDYPTVSRLPPEQAFAPENLGGVITLERSNAATQSYQAIDRVAAGYGMIDVLALPRVRLTGGLRYEDWRLDLLVRDTTKGDRRYTGPDLLYSGNMTIELGPRTNLRFGAFRSVNRPDPREVSDDAYVPVTGDCSYAGNPDLVRARITNTDIRYEFFRRPGEVVSVSGFYKAFDRPLIEFIDIPGGGQCRVRFGNAVNGHVAGAEFEYRRTLDFLPGVLGRLSTGMNLTVVGSGVSIDSTHGRYEAGLDLVGQSPYLVNANLEYSVPERGLSLSVLVNYFADRIKRYGRLSAGVQGPNLLERGRVTLDAKASIPIGRYGLSLSASNLTDAPVELFHRRADRSRVIAGWYKTGTSFSFGIGHAF